MLLAVVDFGVGALGDEELVEVTPRLSELREQDLPLFLRLAPLLAPLLARLGVQTVDVPTAILGIVVLHTPARLAEASVEMPLANVEVSATLAALPGLPLVRCPDVEVDRPLDRPPERFGSAVDFSGH